MFFDWLSREGGALLSWWALSLAAAIAVLPLFYRFLGNLPGRGYALARAGGLLLVGFVFWLLNNLGLLRNDGGSVAFAWLVVFGAGLIAYFTLPDREPFGRWLRENRGYLLATEAVFVALFVGWAAVRALNPDLTATEKPMEMAFLSASRRSAQFPPADPWFSGYAISYYHFGYILMATMANLSGVTNGVAFNLAIALLFALTGTGAFGLVTEMIRARGGRDGQAMAAGLLTAVMIVIMGNLGTVLVELPYQTQTASADYLRFMNLDERDGYGNTACPPSGSSDPAQWCFWWWFRYSRVVRDADLTGNPIGIQPITEFPNFSFVLADMHPHVLALPFTVLMAALGLNLVLGRRRLRFWEFALYAVFGGGMVFLNSWDAVYLAFLIGAEALRRLVTNGTGKLSMEDLVWIGAFGLGLFALTALFYLPFFAGFRSQAGGILPNLIWTTQFQQFFLMFGPFLVIIAAFLWAEVRRGRGRINWAFALQVGIGGAAFLAIALLALGVLNWLRADVRYAVFQVVDESGGFLAVLPGILARRAQGILTHGTLGAFILVILARLFAREPRTPSGLPAVTRHIITYAPVNGFALLLIGAGAVLALVPDFAYLRDGFSVRINTIFKLWYQAWVFFSLASGYALWSILAERRPESLSEAESPAPERPDYGLPVVLRPVIGLIAFALIGAGLVYPAFAITSRAFREGGHLEAANFNRPAPTMTLDGGPSMAMGADDYAAIQCLARTATSDRDVVAEATRARLAYRGDYGRVSALTGIPTLLGWDNHQGQWRGETFGSLNVLTYTEDGVQKSETRADAIAKLYNSLDLREAAGVIQRYGITYIYVGPTEQREFNAEGLAKFSPITPVCESGTVRVYPAAGVLALAGVTVQGR